ncbi:kinase-like domain-containing protein [Suillus discolor]|uniref:Kinase-like domain-containing protein n=1 Tax=Suillus discolor TaxID=1912936 RepID=A0A9P7FBU3_9AGAM|nr:kinase-like domain-containing protein [Suillus discolor]KAG2111205.1 kinase-like domain-containing protein [Suillus discolor]
MPSSPLTLKMQSSRRLAALFTNSRDASHEKSRCPDTSLSSSLVERRNPKDGDRAEFHSDSSNNISEYLNLDLPCPYLPSRPVSSSSAIHPSNCCPSPSPFARDVEIRSLLLSYENEYPSPSSIIESPLPVVSIPALHPASLLGRNYSPRFPEDHRLLETFVHDYRLCDELGSGGYGFVMTAVDRQENIEVAVKFIIKEKVPEQAWMEDEVYGRIPIEVLVLHLVEHENIIKCLEFFEDELFFYLVQELHGSPWHKRKKSHDAHPHSALDEIIIPHFSSPPPVLSPAASEFSVPDSEPETPPQDSGHLPASVLVEGCDSPLTDDLQYHSLHLSRKTSTLEPPRPCYTRRPSHDLFECIEQTKYKRLSEKQARYIMAQVVEAVHYLDSRGIYHRDIKDENLVIDKDFKVKLIDFGSAAIENPNDTSPYYKLFFGTTAYAASEVLLKRSYQAAPAEIWTLGVLMSYLLTGMSPFPTEADAIAGHIVLSELPGKGLGDSCLHLMGRCLEPNPQLRAKINEVRGHQWLKGALDGV